MKSDAATPADPPDRGEGGLRWVGQEVTGHDVRASVVHRPCSLEQVQALVNDARSRRVGLYPVSTGRNWGYGSASPIREGDELVDLSGLTRIQGLERASIDCPIVRIESGVTQGQLHAALQTSHPELTFNVTGSALETSILGNALDRGVGYLGPRAEDIFGLQVVLGTGEILHTGAQWLGSGSPLADRARDVHGPSLDGLFLQGNFGIVVSAGFRLRPRPPCERAVAIGLREPDRLAELVDRLGRLKRGGVLPYVTHLANRSRSLATLEAGMLRYLSMHPAARSASADAESARRTLGRLVKGPWTGLSVVAGTEGQVREAVREVRRTLAGIATVDVWSAQGLDRLARWAHRLRHWGALRGLAAAAHAARPLTALALGRPSDEPVRGLWPAEIPPGSGVPDPDRSPVGLLYVAPLLPLEGRETVLALRALEDIARSHGFDLPVTLNFDAHATLVAITNLAFDRRRGEQVAAAHRCAQALEAWIERRGLAPYRLRADSLRTRPPAEHALPERRAHWEQMARLKRAFDPDGVVAPGRYVAGEPGGEAGSA